MLHRLTLKVTKFQLPAPMRFGTVVKNVGGHHVPPPKCQTGLKAPKRHLPQFNTFSWNSMKMREDRLLPLGPHGTTVQTNESVLTSLSLPGVKIPHKHAVCVQAVYFCP